MRTRIKNLRDGRVIDRSFRSGDKVDKPDFEDIEMQFLYKSGDVFTFMNNKTYEQVELAKDFVGELEDFLQENLVVAVLFHNQKPVTVELPNFVHLKIAHCEPGIKGNTATGATKPATLETGAIVHVPLFINEGDVLKIDTRTRQYVERVNE
jgi:elongation factor P